MTLLFVYGSLKRNFGNNKVLKNIRASYIHNVITRDATYDLVNLGAYPGMVQGSFYIEGEVWELSFPEDIGILDRFEGAPDFYYRRTISINSDYFPWAEAYFLTNSNGVEAVEIVEEYYDCTPVFPEKSIKTWRKPC